MNIEFNLKTNEMDILHKSLFSARLSFTEGERLIARELYKRLCIQLQHAHDQNSKEAVKYVDAWYDADKDFETNDNLTKTSKRKFFKSFGHTKTSLNRI